MRKEMITALGGTERLREVVDFTTWVCGIPVPTQAWVVPSRGNFSILLKTRRGLDKTSPLKIQTLRKSFAGTLQACTTNTRDSNLLRNKTRDVTNRSLDFSRRYLAFFDLDTGRTVEDIITAQRSASSTGSSVFSGFSDVEG